MEPVAAALLISLVSQAVVLASAFNNEIAIAAVLVNAEEPLNQRGLVRSGRHERHSIGP